MPADAFIRRDVSKSASFRPKAQHRAAVLKMLGIIDNQVVSQFLGTRTPAVGFRHRLAGLCEFTLSLFQATRCCFIASLMIASSSGKFECM